MDAKDDDTAAKAGRELSAGAPGYPAALAGAPDAPPSLWMRGQVPVAPAVSVVGARSASRAALLFALELGRSIAGRGWVVVSGGAIGIDTAAHRGAVDAGGATVVVLGSGIDVAYPEENAALFDRAAASGAVLSQFPPGFTPKRWSFPLRNRVIAALSSTTVVIEASAVSGALVTAEAARRYGRRVVACIGSPGCDALAAAGAEPARTVEEVMARLDGVPAPGPAIPDDPCAQRLYDALDRTPRDLGELAARAGVRADQAMAAAVELELGGLVARAAGGRYRKLDW